MKQIRPALILLLLFTVITGIFYPLAVTGLAQLFFPYEANGSMIVKGGKPAGSTLIGQQFTLPKYFWGRLSATTPAPYNAAASGGSNLGPLNPALAAAVTRRIQELQTADPTARGPIPVDLVTASGSGLDPQISIAAARCQIPRVAHARNLSDDLVRSLVERYTEGRQFGILGEARVNVLKLNLALDDLREGS